MADIKLVVKQEMIDGKLVIVETMVPLSDADLAQRVIDEAAYEAQKLLPIPLTIEEQIAALTARVLALEEKLK